MVADGDDTAGIHNHNTIHLLNGRQTMRDDQCRTVFHQTFQRHLHQPLTFGIQRTGSLIQQQDRRIFQDRPRNCHALSLTTGQARTTLTEEGVKTFRQCTDKLIGRRCDCRLFNCKIIGIRFTIANIFTGAVTKQNRFLGHQSNLLP